MIKKNKTVTFVIVLLITILFAASGAAQEKESKACSHSCCDGKTKMTQHSDSVHSQIDHSMMKHEDMNEADEKAGVQTTGSNVKEAAIELPAWNALCPVTGEEIDPGVIKVEYNGKVYGFCCKGCINKFMKNPEKYSKNLSEDGKSFVGTL